MQFLKTLFWVVLAVIVVLFAKGNWKAVELKLWGGLVADVKLPILLIGAFLLGFLPTLLVYRARIWAMRRRMEPVDRSVAAVAPPPVANPVPVDNGMSPRVATDSKVWPSA
jgi:uncharacterized integral membrane protein